MFCPTVPLAATENGCGDEIGRAGVVARSMVVGPTTGWKIGSAPLLTPVNVRLLPPVSLA